MNLLTLRLPLIVIFLYVILLFSSCDQGEQCAKCNSRIDSIFSNLYFRVVLNSSGTTSLSLFDSVNNIATTFEVCNKEILETVELTKIIRGSGNFRNGCTTPNLKIELTEFQIIDICLDPIPNLVGNFSLFNKWYVHYVQNEDTLLYPPCEGIESYILFQELPNYVIKGAISSNLFNGEFDIPVNSTIELSESITQGLVIGTQAQIYYENLFSEVIQRGAVLTYAIDGNRLTIENSSNNYKIKLYLKE